MQLGSSTHGRGAIVLIAIFLLSLAAPTIVAAAVNVPPGATEGDQYFEEVPNGGGSAKPKAGDTTNGGGRASHGVAATQALNALGPDGQKAAALANANRPPQGSAGSTKPGGSQPASSSTEGEGGMGFWFPLLLIVTALAAAAYGLRRRLYPA